MDSLPKRLFIILLLSCCPIVNALAQDGECTHKFVTKTLKEATCTNDGLRSNVCSLCGDSTTSVVPALGHSYSLSSSHKPTCTENGYETYKCTRCTDSYKEEAMATGHDYKTSLVEPTLTEKGYTLHTCSRCKDTYKDNYVDKMTLEEYYSSIKFSEIMPCNLSTYINKDNYNFSGYVEFSNTSTHKINLKNCVMTHYKKTSKGMYSLKWTWEIGNDLTIAASSYGIVWMDESSKTNHSPYKLDADGGYVTLKYDGILIDSLAYAETDAHIAYGRYGNEVGFMQPSPYEKNTQVVSSLSSGRCAKPSFSQLPGIMTGSVSLELKTNTTGAVIYYTMDGTQPSDSNGLLYTEPIKITANANVRAIAYKSGLLPSKIATGSYIYEDSKHSNCGGFTLPIVSITIDNKYYDDPTYGMFVVGTNGIRGEKSCQSTSANYNQDWKRPLNFEYIVDGKRVLSQEVEAAIEGGCSRSEKIKSISLKASKKTGEDQYSYHFFQSKPKVTHKTLHFRNGGTGYSCVPFRDGLIQTFAIGMNIDYQAYQPVAYYLNGEYIGMMALNERTNADYIKSNYGYEEDEIDLISISDQLGVRASQGTKEAYSELLDYLNGNDPTSSSFYAGACARMDMDEYIDYQILQQFIVNTDWPGNNTKIWRAKENGLFRWMLYDTDFGFGLCGYEWLNKSSKNMINWCRGLGSTSWGNQQSWMVTIFKQLAKNAEFKKRFTTRYLIHLSERFTKEKINTVFDSIIGLVSDEYCAFRNGAEDKNIEKMRTFALARPAYIYDHLELYTEGDSVVNFTIDSNVEGAFFSFNGEKVSSFNGKYIAGYDFDIEAYGPMGYVFDRWEISDTSHVKITNSTKGKGAFMPSSISGKMSSALKLKAIFKASDSAMPTLVINEICASSDANSENPDDFGKYPDWIELYNYGNEDINLAGFRLTNSKNNVISELPLNPSDLVIKAGSHKLLWAKGDNRFGSDYLDFKIDNDASSNICLSYLNGKTYETIDCVKYEKHATNSSYGRITDNNKQWTIFDRCSEEDLLTATPSAANGTVCGGYSSQEEMVEVFLTVYPNPTSDRLYLQSSEEIQSFEIYDIHGLLVAQGLYEGAIDIQNHPSGIYFIEAKSANGIYRSKIIKQ